MPWPRERKKMDRLQFAEDIGKSIIRQLYKHFEKNSLDDLEYLPMVKATISGIADELINAGYTKSQVNVVGKALKEYCKVLYVQLWLNQAEEDGKDIGKVTAEKTFDHEWKYGRHPDDDE